MPSPLAQYWSDSARALSVVAANRDLRRVLASWLLGMVAFWSGIALFTLYAIRTYGTGAGSLALVMTFVPGALLAPIESLITDRFPRHRILTAVAALGALAVGAMAVAAALDVLTRGVFLALVVVVGGCRVLVRPSTYGLIPVAAATQRELTAANLVRSTLSSLGALIGPPVATMLFVHVSPSAAFLAVAIVLAAQAAVAIGITAHADLAVDRASRHWRSILSGFLTFGDARIRSVLVLGSMTELCTHAVVVAMATATTTLLDEPDAAFGFLVGAQGAGGILALSLVATLTRTTHVARTGAAWYGAAFGVGVATLALGTSLALALLAMALLGLGAAIGNSSMSRQLQAVTPTTSIGRTTGALMSVRKLASAAGAAGAGYLTATFDAQVALAAIAPLMPLAAILQWRHVSDLDRVAIQVP